MPVARVTMANQETRMKIEQEIDEVEGAIGMFMSRP